MKKTILLLFFPFLAPGVHAKLRDDTLSSKLKIGFSAGGILTGLNTDAFNNLIPSTLPSLHKSSIHLNASLNFYDDSDPFFTNLCVTTSIKKKEHAGIHLEENINFLDVNIGYEFLMQRSQSLYAALGVGQLSYKASYYSNQPNLNFSNAAAVTVGERSFRLKPMYYFNVKGGYTHRISKKSLFSVGLEAGYRIGLNNRPWSLYDNSLNNSPTQNASGAFASLSLIVSNRSDKKK